MGRTTKPAPPPVVPHIMTAEEKCDRIDQHKQRLDMSRIQLMSSVKDMKRKAAVAMTQGDEFTANNYINTAAQSAGFAKSLERNMHRLDLIKPTLMFAESFAIMNDAIASTNRMAADNRQNVGSMRNNVREMQKNNLNWQMDQQAFDQMLQGMSDFEGSVNDDTLQYKAEIEREVRDQANQRRSQIREAPEVAPARQTVNPPPLTMGS